MIKQPYPWNQRKKRRISLPLKHDSIELKILSHFFHWIFTVLTPPKKDLKVVLLCFIGATVIWLFNALNKNYTTDVSCPIAYEFDRTNLVVVKSPPPKININVSAGGWNLLRRTLLFTRYPVKLELQNPASTHFILGSSLITSLSDQLTELTVNSVETDTLFYDIQTRKDKTLTGKINRKSFTLKDFYRVVGPITINPGEFKISGPEKMIDTLPNDFEISIDEDGIDKPFSDFIKLDYLNSKLVSFTPQEVHVSFNVERFILKRIKLPVVPVNFPKDSSAYLADPWINANFAVRKSMEDSVDTARFIITADYKKAVRRDSIVPINIQEVSPLAEDFKPDTTFLKVVYVKRRRSR